MTTRNHVGHEGDQREKIMAVLDMLKRRYVHDFVAQMRDLGSVRDDVIRSAIKAMKHEDFLRALAEEQLKEILDEVFEGESNGRIEPPL